MLEQNDFWADFERAVVFITPPEDALDSEKDCGDEDNIVDIDNRSRWQLRTKVFAKLGSKNDFVNFGEDTGEESDTHLSNLHLFSIEIVETTGLKPKN